MAKTESTAVNELIDLVQSGSKSAASEPGADLFSTPKPKTTTVNPPRMTSPIPPMRGAGDVAPLPRTRAPHSTSDQNAMPAIPPPVRMSTADPSRGNTIPPLSRPTSSPGRSSGHSLPPPRTGRPTSSQPSMRATSSQPAVAPPRTTASQPAVARPRTTASQPQVRASSPVAHRTTVPSIPSLPPPSAPVAAPFEARREDNPFAVLPVVPQQFPVIGRPHTVDVTGDIVKADSWFDVSAAVHKIDEPSWDGTAVVPRPQRETLTLVKKLIVPTVILAIIGIMVGGFFAFDGDGGKKKKTAAAPAAAAESQGDVHQMPVAAAAETPAAAEPAAVAAAEPPTKAEDLSKEEAAKADEAKHAAEAAPESESMLPAATKAVITQAPAGAAKTEPAKIEVAKAQPGKTEPAKTESAKTESAKTEPAKAAPAAVAATASPAKTEIAKAAPAAAAPAKADPAVAKTEPAPVAVKSIKMSSEPGVIREVQTTHGVVKLVDVRIDSKPAGATVMLVDNGKTSFLGSTPLATSVDPSRKYDVIFTYAGRPTQMAPLDPSKTSRLDVTLSRSHGSHKEAAATPLGDSFIEKPAKAEKKAELPKAEKVEAPKAAKTEAPKVEKKAEPPKAEKVEAPKADKKAAAKKTDAKTEKLAEPSFEPPTADKKADKVEAPKADKVEAPKAEKKVAKAEKAAPAGEGTLMVSSKPPCDIVIDGKATGLTTPQRAIPLSAGMHKVTFVNEVAGIKKSVSVTISADQSTKLIQDLMKK